MELTTPISQIPKVGKTTAKKLENIGLKNCQDLLYHFPFRYEDWSKIITIKELKNRGSGTIKAKIKTIHSRRTPRKRMIITEAIVSDQSDSIKVVWFGQLFLNKILKPGQEIYLAGKVESDLNYGQQLISPSYEFPQKQKAPIHLGRLVPIYPTTENISQKQIRFLIREVLPLTRKIEDWLPKEIKNENQLMNLSVALEQIHFPASQNLLNRATHRLKFDELFIIQIQTQLIREKLKRQTAPAMEIKLEKIKDFIKSLPFELTQSQKRSGWEILKDLEKPSPMNRLLEGDVGSGKTVVATMAILNTVLNGYQVAYLAPTEILANQHFNNISSLLKKWPIKIGLLTREDRKIATTEAQKDKEIQSPGVSGASSEIQRLPGNVSKSKILEIITSGELDLVIGTHALIQEGVQFKNLGLIIVDEQHRFGVEQRSALLSDTKNTNTPELHETDKIVEKDLSYKLTGIFFEIQKESGRFLREKQYADLLEEKLKSTGLSYKRESPIEVGGKKSNFADFIIENKILVELKAKPFFKKEDYYQVLRYLESANLRLALVVNFRQKFLKPKRILNPKFKSFACNSRLSRRLVPHFLSMTATPIPRSLALTLYGDLDLSIINEMPPGRKEVKIKIVKPKEKEDIYNFIRKEIKNGRQAFVICPLIDPSDKLGVKSVKEEYEKLDKKIFPDFKLAMLHGKLKAKEKEKIMKDFLNNKIKILVSTTVIEVGIDVPNASIMIIEGAERFGLAQLWQLKGRVGRAQYQSYCFLFSESYSEKVRQRLSALLTAKNGFELAEKDLEIRGPGEIFGLKQSGYLESLKIARLSDTEIIKETQEAAKKILTLDPELKNFPLLQEKIKEITKITHLE